MAPSFATAWKTYEDTKALKDMHFPWKQRMAVVLNSVENPEDKWAVAATLFKKGQDFMTDETTILESLREHTTELMRPDVGISEVAGMLVNLDATLKHGTDMGIFAKEFQAEWKALWSTHDLDEVLPQLNLKEHPDVIRNLTSLRAAVKSLFQWALEWTDSDMFDKLRWLTKAFGVGFVSMNHVLALVTLVDHTDIWAERLRSPLKSKPIYNDYIKEKTPKAFVKFLSELLLQRYEAERQRRGAPKAKAKSDDTRQTKRKLDLDSTEEEGGNATALAAQVKSNFDVCNDLFSQFDAANSAKKRKKLMNLLPEAFEKLQTTLGDLKQADESIAKSYKQGYKDARRRLRDIQNIMSGKE